jgi:hypothetical protein
MVSRENAVISVFVLLALGLSFGTGQLEMVPSEVSLGLLLFVGVIAPLLLNEYWDGESGNAEP